MFRGYSFFNSFRNGSNFSWTLNSSISQVNTASTQVWPDITTQYNVQFTSSNNCQAEDSVIVFVNPNPGTSLNFTLNGSATSLANNTYQMTTSILNDFASLWNNSMIDLSQSFQIDAELNFGHLTLLVQMVWHLFYNKQATSYAPTGANNQFAIIDPSFIVEFDTWNNQNNNDIVDDHIAILKDGSSNHNINSLTKPNII